MRTFWRVCGLVALLVTTAGAASASAITKLGVMTGLGREIQVVIQAPTVGTRVDRNAKDTLKVGNEFENFILRAVVDSARREGLVEPLILARPGLGSLPWQRDGQAVLVTRPLLEAAQAAKLSHLVLIQPARDAASLKLFNTVTGSGQLEGLGFYVDTALQVQRVDNNQRSVGFLAPYAYFDVYLVEVATLDLQAEYRARASLGIAEPEHQGNDPWQALSTERKVTALQQLIREEIDKAVGALVHPSAATPPPVR